MTVGPLSPFSLYPLYLAVSLTPGKGASFA